MVQFLRKEEALVCLWCVEGVCRAQRGGRRGQLTRWETPPGLGRMPGRRGTGGCGLALCLGVALMAALPGGAEGQLNRTEIEKMIPGMWTGASFKTPDGGSASPTYLYKPVSRSPPPSLCSLTAACCCHTVVCGSATPGCGGESAQRRCGAPVHRGIATLGRAVQQLPRFSPPSAEGLSTVLLIPIDPRFCHPPTIPDIPSRPAAV